MTITNNYASTLASVKSALVAFLSYGSVTGATFSPSLDSLATSESDYMGITISRSTNVDVKLSVNVSFGNTVKDDEGNVFRTHDISVSVDWSSYGNNPANLALARAELYVDVAKVAVELEREFSGKRFYSFVSSAADVAAATDRREADERARALIAKAAEVVSKTAARSHMRVGKEKIVSDVEIADLPAGTYEVPFDGKVFTLTHMQVVGGNVGTITRLARVA